MRTNGSISILTLISSAGYFGVENMLVNLGDALSGMGCQCTIGVLRDSRFGHVEVAEKAAARGLATEIIPCSGRLDWRAIGKIRTLVQERNINVIHSHGYKADLYAFAAASRRSVGLIATSHNWPNEAWSMRAYAALDRLVLRSFDQVVIVSEDVGGILRKAGVSGQRISRIPNGVDVELYRGAIPTLKREIGEHRKLIGFVGRLVPGKGGDILLRAATCALENQAMTKIVFVGEGPCRAEWESLAGALGLRDRVIFTGVRGDMPGVYASFDLMVLPSLCEAMPMCVLEAMAAGIPVIATRVGATPQIVSHGRTGVLVEPGDEQGLGEAIAEMLSNPGEAQRLAAAAQANVAEKFSSDHMAEQYIRLYQSSRSAREKCSAKILAPTA